MGRILLLASMPMERSQYNGLPMFGNALIYVAFSLIEYNSNSHCHCTIEVFALDIL